MFEAGERAVRRIESRVPAGLVAPGQLPFVLRTVVGMAVLAFGANIVGALVVAVLAYAVNPTVTDHQRAVMLGSSIGLVAVTMIAGTSAAILLQRRTLRFVLRGLAPDRADARRAVRLPLDLAVIATAGWALNAIVMTSLAAALGLDGWTVFGIASGIILAGMSAVGVTYLLVSRVAAPVIRIALTAHPPRASMMSVRSRLLLIWALTSGVPVLGILLILIGPPGRPNSRSVSIVTACIALAVGGVSTALIARTIGAPLRGLVGSLRAVGEGDLGTEVTVDDPGEIGLLQSGVNDMVAGLRERDRVQDLFGRHVGPAVAQEALRSGVTLSGENRDVVALFVDITGSTALTHSTEPAEFVAMLNRFFTVVVEEVERGGGLVNKFEGDAALCVFGAPVALADAATAALRAARGVRDRVGAAGEVKVGIGVAAGPVVAGQIGSRSRLEYTVIGDAVNEAARLTDIAKQTPGCVLASDDVLERASADERRHWSLAAELVLRGRIVPTRAWTA
jgi:adenylate cyclase